MRNSSTILIIPFIKLYMSGISDIKYENLYIAVLLIGTIFFEIIHIPSGNIINVSGRFKAGKNIQVLACITLFITMIIGNYIMGFYGVLTAVLITAIVLAVSEIIYVHMIFFNKAFSTFLRILIPNVVISILIVLGEMLFWPDIKSILQFVISGIILTVINGIAVVITNYLTNRELTVEIYRRFKPQFKSLLGLKSKI